MAQRHHSRRPGDAHAIPPTSLDLRRRSVPSRPQDASTEPPDIPLTDAELIAEYDGWLLTVNERFRSTYGASREDAEDAAQDCRIKLLKVKPQHRHHRLYVKTTIQRQLCTSYARYRRVNDPLLAADPDWDAETPDAADTGLLATLEAEDDGSLETMLSSEYVTKALAALSTEQALVLTLHLGLGSADTRPIRDMRTLSKRSFVSEARLPQVIASALARLRRWHRESQ
jgi:DNA-directed RNA polymerase specialized sigma24 family protein